MKVLLDEDLPHKLRERLPGHDVYTVAYMGWGGLKNGELLKAALEAGFDHAATIAMAISTAEAGKVTKVECGTFSRRR